MMRLVIIGGSDAGISAGLRAREVNPDAMVTLLVADAYPNFSVCGLPFYVSGETEDWRQLAHKSRVDLDAAGLDLRLETTATAIDSQARTVTAQRGDGREQLPYDTLIIATGSRPRRPRLEGIDQTTVHYLHTVDDARALRRVVDDDARSALIVGGGYIGLEMADAFRHRGLDVTVVQRANQVMTTVDRDFAAIVEAELRRNGVTLRLGEDFDGSPRRAEDRADIVLVAAGVDPNSALAAEAGLELGAGGAIHVDRQMRTSVKHVFAAGDCVETWHRVLDSSAYVPLGTTSHKQGRIAGENAAGGTAEFAGSLSTQVVKVFDLAVARTGLRQSEATVRWDPLSADVEVDDHKAYYPGATRLRLRVTGDRRTGQLLGAQIVGDHRAQVAKRIDIFAAALYAGLSVADLVAMDLSYTPPFSAPWDPVQAAALAWMSAAAGRGPASPGA